MPDPVLATSLPGEINAATRSLHTTLNRLITSRLPLSLPPHATNPTLYTTGLLHFSHIFFTIESLWADLFATPNDPPTSPLLSFLLVNPYDSPELFSSPPSLEMLRFLQVLRPRGLARSNRLKKDLEFLTGLHPTDLDVLLAQYPGDKVAEYCAHIRKVVRHKPHVLVAYAWCFYMAVFSGGRWIRSQLAMAGDDFWRSATSDDGKLNEKKKDGEEYISLQEKGLSFWNFDGEHDGEDIKAEFKRRLASAEQLFTPNKRVDVIEEAKEIFRLSATLVDELDEKLGTDAEKLKHLDHIARKRAQEVNKADEITPMVSQSSSMSTWLKRPEVTGAFVALGCLAFVALLKLDPMVGW